MRDRTWLARHPWQIQGHIGPLSRSAPGCFSEVEAGLGMAPHSWISRCGWGDPGLMVGLGVVERLTATTNHDALDRLSSLFPTNLGHHGSTRVGINPEFSYEGAAQTWKACSGGLCVNRSVGLQIPADLLPCLTVCRPTTGIIHRKRLLTSFLTRQQEFTRILWRSCLNQLHKNGAVD